MTITPRNNGFLVTVKRASAKPGFQRVRKVAATHAEAVALEAEIIEALSKYGQWPLDVRPAKETPRDTPQGTLREAAKLALQTHWKGMVYYRSVKDMIWPIVEFMEKRGKYNIDDILSEDIDALVSASHEAHNSPSYMNKKLGIIRIINQVALRRDPPLATKTIMTPHQKGGFKEKWWLRPEDHATVTALLRNPLDASLMTDPMFADFIDIIVFQGLRVEEALRLLSRNFSGLDTKTPWLKPDGTKTHDAQNSIPVYPEAVPVVQQAIARCQENGWTRLFPITLRQAGERWNLVRDFLGVRDIPTSTLKSLRRTFAWYANSRGMPTSTLQKVLRHKSISTTQGYLELTGSGEVAHSRQYFEQDSTHPPRVQPEDRDLVAVLTAFRATGATPEEIARFAKELMT
jgi:integrase